MSSRKFKVGDRAISVFHQEDVTIVGYNGSGYDVTLDRFPDGGHYHYWENELEPWRYRRFVIDGNHYMRMYDDADPHETKFCGSGTWGVRDKVADKIVFYITSGHSRAVAMEICKQMNAGLILKELT